MTLLRHTGLRIVLLGAAVAAIIIAVWRPDPGDYSHTLGNPDDAGPAVWALAHGRFGGLPETQPLMGAASLILRAPLAAIGDSLGGIRLEYWLGAFGCLTALAVLALALGAEASRRSTILAGAVAAALVLLNPASTQSISMGHPEELLLAAAATGAVWATVRGRAVSGAALAGTAIGTLPFGVAAVIATWLATKARRAMPIAIAALVGLLLVLPLPLTAPHTYLEGSRQLSQYRRVYPQSAWWWVSHDRLLLLDTGRGEPEHATVRVLPVGLDRGAGLLAALAVALTCSWLVVRRNPGRALGYDALGLLAVLFVLRSALDPLNLEYYVAPGIVAFVAWEVLARNRLPLAAAVAVAGDTVVFHSMNGHDTLQATAYALWCIGLCGYLLAAIRPRACPQFRHESATDSSYGRARELRSRGGCG